MPSLVIWGFGIPAFAWIVLAKNKDVLELTETREKYGFLYNGYKKNYYFWESVNMYRKITIIFISVFLKIAGIITQALVVFLVLILFLILNLKLLPFTFKSLNDMEIMSLITAMLTIYWGLFFLSDNPEVYNSSDTSVKEADNGLRLNEGTKWFFFCVIVISNLSFILYWILKMAGELKNTIRTKFSKVYLYICLCGNKTKLQEELKQRAIKDEHDILKEEFDNQLNALRNLWHSNPNVGKLVLSQRNIEKTALYLNPDKFLQKIIEKKEPTIYEIKKRKRNERIKQTNMLMNNINSSILSFANSDISEYRDTNIELFKDNNLNKFKDKMNTFTDNDSSIGFNFDKKVNNDTKEYSREPKVSNDYSVPKMIKTTPAEEKKHAFKIYTEEYDEFIEEDYLPQEEKKVSKAEGPFIPSNIKDVIHEQAQIKQNQLIQNKLEKTLDIIPEKKISGLEEKSIAKMQKLMTENQALKEEKKLKAKREKVKRKLASRSKTRVRMQNSGDITPLQFRNRIRKRPKETKVEAILKEEDLDVEDILVNPPLNPKKSLSKDSSE